MTDTSPDPREARLPVWARRELSRLRANVTDLQDRVRVREGSPEAARVVLDPYREDLTSALDDRGHVRYFLEDAEEAPGHRAYVDVLMEPVHSRTPAVRHLVIRGARGLMVSPSASNVVNVTLLPD